MELPKNEKTFSVDIKGDTTHQRYAGQFTTLCALTISQKHQQEIEKSRLQADLAFPSEKLIGFSVILSTLQVKLVNYPDWWRDNFDGVGLLDENVIVAVYNQVEAAEKEWKEQVQKSAEALPSPSSDKGESESGDQPSA